MSLLARVWVVEPPYLWAVHFTWSKKGRAKFCHVPLNHLPSIVSIVVAVMDSCFFGKVVKLARACSLQVQSAGNVHSCWVHDCWTFQQSICMLVSSKCCPSWPIMMVFNTIDDCILNYLIWLVVLSPRITSRRHSVIVAETCCLIESDVSMRYRMELQPTLERLPASLVAELPHTVEQERGPGDKLVSYPRELVTFTMAMRVSSSNIVRIFWPRVHFRLSSFVGD